MQTIPILFDPYYVFGLDAKVAKGRPDLLPLLLKRVGWLHVAPGDQRALSGHRPTPAVVPHTGQALEG